MKKKQFKLVSGLIEIWKSKLLLTMKLTVIALCLTVFQGFALMTNGQNAKVNLKMENVSIKQVLSSIEEQTNLFFMYNGKLVDVERKVNINADSKDINIVLKEIFSGTNIKYEIDNRQILLSNLVDTSGLSSLQQKIVSGKVTDSSGSTLPGVSVVVKGTTSGTITDMDGQYSLSNVPANATLIFSFVGMKTQEIAVGVKTTINATLVEETVGIEEVVAIGYGSSKKRDITGSISTIKSEELVVTPTASTSNSLVGKVSGLQAIQGSGEPGADASKISIRGFGTPLVIVDGVEQSFNNIAGDEIETISVLKDASAAIYGARAGNGVILVTTKRGKSGKPVISVNSSLTYSGNINFPKPMSAGQYTELYREAQINSGTNPSQTKYSQAEIDKYYAGTDPDYTSTNWWKATMNDWSPMQQHDISLRGGSENIKYYAFAGYTRQDGMFKTGDNLYNRYNIRSNIDANVTKNLSMELNLSAILGDRSRSAQGIEEGGNFWNEFFLAKPTNPAFLPDNTKIAYSGGPLAKNPVINTSKEIGGYNQINTQDLKGSLGFKYNLPGIKGLYLKAFGNYQYSFSDNKTFSKFVQTYTYSYANKAYTARTPTGPTSLSERMAPGSILTGQFSLNYSKIINEKHEISGMVLYEVISSYSKDMYAYREKFLSSSIDYLFAGATETQQNDGSASESGRESYVGRLNYKFANKYLAEVTMRYDGSPNFPPATRWGFFPSLSAGWVMSEEPFIKNNVLWINSLKLRSSYSNTGYDNIGAFQYIAGFNLGQKPYALNGVTQMGIAISGIPNPNISWEKMNTYNIGFDFSLFKNVFYGEADVFYRVRNGILGTRVLSLPTTFGAVLPSENVNSSTDRGFEFLVGFRKNLGDFSLDISGNISWARSKWDHYDEPAYTDPEDIRVNRKSGQWTDIVWGYKTNGLFKTQQEIDNLGYDLDGTGNKSVRIGDIKYIDRNGDKKLDWKDYEIIGKGGLPKTMFGLNWKLDYKNFDMTGLLQGATGRSIDVMQGVSSEQSVALNVFTYRWSESNPDPNAIYPRQSFNGNNRKTSDFWRKDATYLRLKQLSIGYNLPKQFIGRIGIENFRLYVSGTNLFTISGLDKYSVDPETPGDIAKFPGSTYPHQRTINLGLNLSL